MLICPEAAHRGGGADEHDGENLFHFHFHFFRTAWIGLSFSNAMPDNNKVTLNRNLPLTVGPGLTNYLLRPS